MKCSLNIANGSSLESGRALVLFIRELSVQGLAERYVVERLLAARTAHIARTVASAWRQVVPPQRRLRDSRSLPDLFTAGLSELLSVVHHSPAKAVTGKLAPGHWPPVWQAGRRAYRQGPPLLLLFGPLLWDHGGVHVVVGPVVEAVQLVDVDRLEGVGRGRRHLKHRNQSQLALAS